MKKNYYILFISFIALFTSCSKKEAILPEPGVFASVKFNDPFSLFNGPDGASTLKMLYQGKPIVPNAASILTVLPGEGKFEFFNTSGKVLEKSLDIPRDKVKNYVFFKPDENSNTIELIENNQADEPKPGEDFIKLKIANFAQAIFGNKNIKLVFSQKDPLTNVVTTFDPITIQGKEYSKDYILMPRGSYINRGTKRMITSYKVSFLDENDQPILDSNNVPRTYDWNSGTKFIFTLFVKTNNDRPVISVLFSD